MIIKNKKLAKIIRKRIIMPYLSNDRIRLRAMEPEDLEVLYTMENDPQSWDITNFNVPYSRFQIRQFIENSQADAYADQQIRLMVERLEDKTVLGTIDIDGFSPMHQRGDVGIAIRADYQHQGYGTDALCLLCDYAFGFLRLNQLTAHIAVDNELSLKLFHAAGFEDCGLLRRWWRVGGEFKDVIVLQKIR